MKLEEKGHIQPPIVLNEPMESVSKKVQTWDKVISATHWNLFNQNEPDGADFYVLEEELGHIHLDGDLHLATQGALQKVLLDKKLASRFPYSPGWVQFSIQSEKDAKHALWLMELNYKRLMGSSMQELQELIDHYSNTL